MEYENLSYKQIKALQQATTDNMQLVEAIALLERYEAVVQKLQKENQNLRIFNKVLIKKMED